MDKPYYQDEWVTIYHADCREILPQLPKVDLVLTDPPYNVLQGQDWDKQWADNSDYFQWFDGVYNSLSLLCKGSFYIFWAQKNIYEYGKRYHPDRMLIWWHKNLLKPTCNMWLWSYDPIFYHKNGGKIEASFVRGENVDVLEYPKPQNWGREIVRQHPAEKPTKLIDRLILVSSEPNDSILDPFLGSGTTCYCAKKLNRKSIGIEIEEKYCEIAANRCRQMVMEF